ncbi:MAG: GTPase ObgE [bacterium]
MFVDELTLKVVAGNGGDGCTSFRREKYIPMGGPDGGNGGRGADVVFKVDKNLKTLLDLKTLRCVRGERGEHGKGGNKYGKGKDAHIVSVPEGTVVYNEENNMVICDLTDDGQEFVVAKGGRGGKGNKAFSTHENPAPEFSEFGEPGEEKILRIELKMLADIGLVGMPSVGKSTLLSVISSSKPKIGAYHFTTLSPNLGVVKSGNHETFIVADLPGLIEGASTGIGLGDKFLKHAMRTRILAHVLDMGASEGRSPIEDYELIRKEIDKFNDKLSQKKEIIVANKMDLPDAAENLLLFKKKYPDATILEISAMNNEKIDVLLDTFGIYLDQTPKTDLFSKEEFEDYIVYEFKKEESYSINKEDGIWVISGPRVEKLLKMTKLNESEAVKRFARTLNLMGIEDELEKLGAKAGDDVSILDFIFTYKS